MTDDALEAKVQESAKMLASILDDDARLAVLPMNHPTMCRTLRLGFKQRVLITLCTIYGLKIEEKED